MSGSQVKWRCIQFRKEPTTYAAASPRRQISRLEWWVDSNHLGSSRNAASLRYVIAVWCGRRASRRPGENMPRYMVERSFPDGLHIPLTEAGAQTCLGVVGRNAELGVTWVHSYVSEDKRKTFCVYDAPNPDAIRKAAERSQLPVEKITKVAVLDPYFYR